MRCYIEPCARFILEKTRLMKIKEEEEAIQRVWAEYKVRF